MNKKGCTFNVIHRGLALMVMFIWLTSTAPASAERMVFHNIFQNNKKVEHQLSGINHIIQDPQGFIWFGSEKGLARYDGADTKIYRHDPTDRHSINHNFIRGLLVDDEGEMWVATETGLCRYLVRLDHFTCEGEQIRGEWPKVRVSALALGHRGEIYVGSNTGLYIISANRGDIRRHQLLANTALVITAIAIDTGGTVWLGTDEHGLLGLSPDGKLIFQYSARSDDSASLVHNRISALTVDSSNNLWIGTYGGGLSILDPSRTQFENHSYQGGKPGTLSSNIIWDVFEDSTGTIWLGVDQGGLVRVDGERGFVATRHKPYDPASLPSDQVRTLFEDNNNDLWIGLFPSGVSFYNRATGEVQSYKHEPDNSSSLSHSAVLAIHQDTSDNIWIGTEDGLNLFDPQRQTFTRYRLTDIGLSAKAVLSIAQYDNNTLWVGTWSGGLLAFDLATRQFTPINIGRLNGTGKNSLFIWDILRDRQGNMWVATEFEGVGVYDRAADRFHFFAKGDLPSNFAWAVMEDQRGAVWMATDTGLAILQPGAAKPTFVQRGQAEAGGLQAERIIALQEDRRGRVWVGSQDNGTFVYHPSTASFQHIGEQQGLPPGMSSGFVEDAQGNMWILSSNGLIKVDGDSLKLQVFGSENGLAGNNFNRSAALKAPSGHLYIGGADGFNIFDPTQLKDNEDEFPVHLTALRILNKNVRPAAAQSPLQQAIIFTRSLNLNHHHSMFSFDFAALDYRNTQDTRFAYKLDGFDAHWNDIGTNRTATYTNIPPGDYQFHVRASKGKDDWVQAPPLHISIAPAPWRSGWAYLTYLALAIGAGYLLFHYFQLRGHTRLYKSLSATDALTGISNRLGVTEAAKLLFDKTPAGELCVLFIDVDHFKRINDTRGHDSGDRILREVATILQRSLRRADSLGRWGGEEFLVVYSHLDQADALRLAERIRSAVASAVFDQQQSALKVTLSIGCAFVKPSETFEAAVKRADSALYEAKGAGRNCVVVAGE